MTRVADTKSSTKSIIFINRVYPPDNGATGQLLAELAAELSGLGWRITVIAARTAPGETENASDAKVDVRRVSALPFTRRSHWRRALSYLSLYPALLWQGWRSPPADIIVTLTDPPLSAALGPVLKWTTGARLVHWAQDIYPELAEELGVLTPSGLLAGVLRRVSNWALRRHDGIIVIGECMQRRFDNRGAAMRNVPVRIVPNWVNSRTVRPSLPENNPFRTEHGLQDRFVVMYSGNLGLAHPFETIIDAAEILAETLPQAVLLFVGEGPRLPWVKQTVSDRALRNVKFLPFQPKARLGESLSAADLHLVSMHHRLCGLVVPSKVYGILAAGRPCLFLGPADSTAARVIVEHGSGDVLERSDGVLLAARIQEWFDDETRRISAGLAARRAAEAWSVEQAADAFSTVLDATVLPEA